MPAGFSAYNGAPRGARVKRGSARGSRRLGALVALAAAAALALPYGMPAAAAGADAGGTPALGEFATAFYEPGIVAFTAFLTDIASSGPKIIAASILLVIGLVAGKVVGRVVEKVAARVLHRAHVDDDEVIRRATGEKESAHLVAASIRWFIYLFFIIAAINALEFEQLSSALTELWLWVPNLLAFILIVVIGLIVANFIGRWLDQELVKSDVGGSRYVKMAAKAVVYAIVVAIALTQLGIGSQIIPILVSAFSWSIAVGIGAAVAIGLGFALKDILPAAIHSASRQRSVLRVGQRVRIGEHEGVVTAVELLHIVVASDRNESTVIPTGRLAKEAVTIIGEAPGREGAGGD